MIATAPDGSPSFDMSSLGTVSSWTGPSDFAAPPKEQVKAVLVDTPHLSGQ